jgi:integrase
MSGQDIIGRLYDFNHWPENWALKQYSPVSKQDATKLHEWGGGLTRRALHAIYTISFLCLLRIDEVLKIRRSHIEFEEDRIILTLPFRKTHQYGREFSAHISPTTS